jgi:hypothetical protein
MSKTEVIFTFGYCDPFRDTGGPGIKVDDIGSKDCKEVHFEESIFIRSQGMHRRPPFLSTSIPLDNAINFFEACIEACQKIKNDMGD